jgi:uncharacterized protein YjbI with pentapeptide repeats
MKPPSKNNILVPRIPNHLSPSDFTKIEDQLQATDCILADRDFSDQNASNLDFEKVVLRRIIFQRSQLKSVRLLDCQIERCDLSGANLEKARFQRVELSGCRLLGAIFMDGRFDDLCLSDCNAEGANFVSSTFKAARFEKCVLKGVTFEGADLTGVVFHECDLSGADLRNAKLKDTDFRSSTIDGLKTGIKELQGAIIAPMQAIQVVNILGIHVKESDQPIF